MTVEITRFGMTAAGAPVDKITLSNAHLTVSVLNWGAVLQSVRLAGVDYDLTLGSDQIADYQGAMSYYGSLIAPVVNRLTGARAVIDGVPARFQANFLGEHVLHSGDAGAQNQIWAVKTGADEVILSLTLPDGAGGFPGNRQVQTRFWLDGATLGMAVSVISDKATLWNTANHSYWNLDGTATYDGHLLQILADHYLPTDAAFLPTGEVRAVEGTEMDFRTPRPVAPHAPPLDNNFCLGRAQTALRPVLMLTGAKGVTMTVSTTECGIQLYDHRHSQPKAAPYAGLAIEAQSWPDAPHNPAFPDITLHAGQSRTQTTSWHFAKRTDDAI